MKELKNNLCHRLSHEGHRSSSQSFADRWHQCVFCWSHEIRNAHLSFHHCSSAFFPSACNEKQYHSSSAVTRHVPAVLTLRDKFWKCLSFGRTQYSVFLLGSNMLSLYINASRYLILKMFCSFHCLGGRGDYHYLLNTWVHVKAFPQ